jgi:hypothetical protein
VTLARTDGGRKDNRLVAGHTRIAALESILAKEPAFVPRDAPGVGLVPVRFHEFTDESEAAAYALADNRLSELADWDEVKLGAILAELQQLDESLLAETGFGEREIERLIREAGGDAGTGSADDPGADLDHARELQAKWQTASGQLWEIPSATVKGKAHRLLCGDSTNRDDVLRLMAGEKAALCATDPPYLVDYTGERPDHDGGNQGGKDWTAVYHEVEIKDVVPFFRSVFQNVLAVLAPHSAIYCWHAHKRVTDIVGVWRELGIHDHQQLIWVKPTPVFGRVFWHFRHEPCLMGWRKGSIPQHDGDQSIDSVWEIDWEGKARVVGNDHLRRSVPRSPVWQPDAKRHRPRRREDGRRQDGVADRHRGGERCAGTPRPVFRAGGGAARDHPPPEVARAGERRLPGGGRRGPGAQLPRLAAGRPRSRRGAGAARARARPAAR